LRSLRIILRVDLLEECLEMEVNCLAKGVGNIFRSSEVVWLIWGERNGLVWRDGFLFAGKGFEHGPEFSGICFRRGVGESFSPFFFSIFGANGLDLLVKKLDLWRGRVLLADMVSLFHEGGGFQGGMLGM